jgi:Fe-S-cluster containining protein
MPRTLRIAIVGSSPCDQCVAACCKQNGHAYAVLLQGDAERRRFAAWAADVPVRNADGAVVVEKVLSYRGGRCPFLGDDDRCTIYQDRPLSCRQFECVRDFNRHGVQKHGRFLELNPAVLEMLSELSPSSAAAQTSPLPSAPPE